MKPDTEDRGSPDVDRGDFEAVFRDLPTHGWLKVEEARLLWDAARSTSRKAGSLAVWDLVYPYPPPGPG